MKLGLIGASAIAAKVTPVIQRIDSIEIVGVASQSSERGSEFATKHQVAFLGDYQSIYRNSNIDAVYITTANNDHEATIKDALISGKHVICEKPLVLRKDSAELLFKIAAENKLILIEGLMYRFHPQIIALKRKVLSNNYGRVLRVKANLSFDYGGNDMIKRRLESGGGALPDLGCYLIDFVNSFTEASPLVQQTTFKDSVSFNSYLKFESGLVAEITSSMAYPSLNTWEVICERASFSVNRYNPHERCESELTIINDESEKSIERVTSDGSGLDQFAAELINFGESIKGTVQPFISPAESISNADLLEQLIRT